MVACFELAQFNRPPVPLTKLELLDVGMTKDEVEALLGKPASVEKSGVWCYDSPHSWPLVTVYFDEQGRFVESVYDY